MKRCLALFAALVAALTVTGCGSPQGSPSSPRVAPQPAATTQSATGSVAPRGWGSPAPASAHLYAVSPISTAVMYDTVTLGAVPRSPFALAGYTAGFWPTFLPLRRAYPDAHVVSIAIGAGYHADCLDVEPGDATPGQVPGWVRAEIHLGWPKPCLYSDWWEFVNEIAPTLTRAGIKRANVYEWVADYTGRPHIDTGYDATQWTDRALGRNLDESLVLRSFLAIAHPALVPPAPKPPAPKPKPKPKPKPGPSAQTVARWHRELAAHVRLRSELRVLLTKHACRPPLHAKPRSYHTVCGVWLRHGAVENRLILSFNAKGVR